MRRGGVWLFSGGMFLLPTAGPVQELLQPNIPPPEMVAPERATEKGVPGYACGHPRSGYEYAKLKGVGNLPKDLLTGGWVCSDGCGAEIDCALWINHANPKSKTVGEFLYVYRQRKP